MIYFRFKVVKLLYCFFKISVADENDNAPRFYQKNYVFRIAENEKVGKFVGSVKANDSDIDKTTNGRVTYSFVEGGSPFNIDPIKGNFKFWLLCLV